MKKVLFRCTILIIFPVIIMGCNPHIDFSTTVDRVELLICLSTKKEVLLMRIKEGALLAGNPSDSLKDFVKKIKPGGRIFLKARASYYTNTLLDPSFGGIYNYRIDEIIVLESGERYKHKS